MPVDEVVELLWRDLPPDGGRARLRNLLNRLRQTSGGLIVRDGEVLRLARGVDVDVRRFDAAARRALSAVAAGDVSGPALARAALAMHEGPLLSDSPYEPWAAAPRERNRRRLLELIDVLAAHDRDEGRLDEAVRLLERAIELDAYDEERYVVAAEIRTTQGRHGAALALLRRAHQVVDELGLPPSSRLTAVDERLRG
jgi:DNA-binding SARP family transcriptional activator